MQKDLKEESKQAMLTSVERRVFHAEEKARTKALRSGGHLVCSKFPEGPVYLKKREGGKGQVVLNF